MTPEDVPIDMTEIAAKATWVNWDEDMGSEDFESATEEIREVLAAVLPQFEKQVREQVAREILAVEPLEWALAGQHAGLDAAKIARGES